MSSSGPASGYRPLMRIPGCPTVWPHRVTALFQMSMRLLEEVVYEGSDATMIPAPATPIAQLSWIEMSSPPMTEYPRPQSVWRMVFFHHSMSPQRGPAGSYVTHATPSSPLLGSSLNM